MEKPHDHRFAFGLHADKMAFEHMRFDARVQFDQNARLVDLMFTQRDVERDRELRSGFEARHVRVDQEAGLRELKNLPIDRLGADRHLCFDRKRFYLHLNCFDG